VPIISVHNLSKTFQLKEKAAGLRGSLAALARPRFRAVEAVRAISLENNRVSGLSGSQRDL
jgi:ABC-type uncharacterized transport system ATPase subunit